MAKEEEVEGKYDESGVPNISKHSSALLERRLLQQQNRLAGKNSQMDR